MKKAFAILAAVAALAVPSVRAEPKISVIKGKATVRGTGDLTVSNAQTLTYTVLDTSALDGNVTFEFTSSGAWTDNALSADWISIIRAADGKVTFRFSGSSASNGFHVDFVDGDSQNKIPLAAHLVFASGTHKMTRGVGVSSGDPNGFLFGTGASDGNPTLRVLKDAVVGLNCRNLSYAPVAWNNEKGKSDPGGVIRVDAGGTLNFTQAGGNNKSFNYHQRLYLEPGSVTAFRFVGNAGQSYSPFQLWGGTSDDADASKAQIYVPAGSGTAVFAKAEGGGDLMIGHDANFDLNGLVVFVGEGSKLRFDCAIKGKKDNAFLLKLGEGDLEVTGACEVETRVVRTRIEVAVVSTNRFVGAETPVYKATVTGGGSLGGADLDWKIWCEADDDAGAGTYVLFITGAVHQANLEVCYVNGLLTVEDPLPEISEAEGEERVAAVLADSPDELLKTKVTSVRAYADYREWVDAGVAAGTIESKLAAKGAIGSFFSFATDQRGIADTAAITEEKVEVTEVEVDKGGVTLTVGIQDLPVGEGARQDYLEHIFGVTGTGSLDEEFAAEKVVYREKTMVRNDDGTVSYTVEPKRKDGEAKPETFFFRVHVAK